MNYCMFGVGVAVALAVILVLEYVEERRTGVDG